MDDVWTSRSDSVVRIEMKAARSEAYCVVTGFCLLFAVLMLSLIVFLWFYAPSKHFDAGARIVMSVMFFAAAFFVFGLLSEFIWSTEGREELRISSDRVHFRRTFGTLAVLSREWPREAVIVASVKERSVRRRGGVFVFRDLEIATDTTRLRSWARFSADDADAVNAILADELGSAASNDAGQFRTFT